MGILYIVATPIGNLEDISLRALRTLFGTEHIACEDTRRTGLLFKLLREKFPHVLPHDKIHEIHQFLSYYEENEQRRIPEIITILKSGNDVALISDAGTPAISDPGFKLIRKCVKEGIKVLSIPGPSAAISALVTSGLPTDKFLFLGYLPRKQGNRNKLLLDTKEALIHVNTTVILYEAPHRLVQTLEALQEVFGDIEIAICKELTKVHEVVRRGTISQLVEQYKKQKAKGEYVILFHIDEVENDRSSKA